MTTVEMSAQAGQSLTHETMLIDLDVHERPAQGLGMRDLIPYIDPHWAQYLSGENGMWPGPAHGSFSYIMPVSKNGVREDWNRPTTIAGGGSSLDDMRADLIEREGVTVPIINGPLFFPSMQAGDPDFAVALAQAYNDYQVAEWLDPEPRLRGSVHVAAQLPETAAREIDRMAEHPQIVQVVLPLTTRRQWGDPHYRPIWEAAVRHGLPVTFHHTTADPTLLGWPRYYVEYHTMVAPQMAQHQVMSLVINGCFERYPELKVVMLESGVTWIFWLMWRLDQQFRELRAGTPWVKRLPSEYIRDNVKAATQPITEITPRLFQQLVEATDTAGVFVFASDYPHYDADSPDVLNTLPDELRYRVRYQNALEIFPSLRALMA
jgi:predicted TIM-barrel fold metal-dependent hydrolase